VLDLNDRVQVKVSCATELEACCATENLAYANSYNRSIPRLKCHARGRLRDGARDWAAGGSSM